MAYLQPMLVTAQIVFKTKLHRKMPDYLNYLMIL